MKEAKNRKLLELHLGPIRTNCYLKILTDNKKDLDVKIGSENKFKPLENSSVIMAQYDVGGENHGSIGIIGPTRIDYATLIPSVRYLTDMVGKILSQVLNED